MPARQAVAAARTRTARACSPRSPRNWAARSARWARTSSVHSAPAAVRRASRHAPQTRAAGPDSAAMTRASRASSSATKCGGERAARRGEVDGPGRAGRGPRRCRPGRGRWWRAASGCRAGRRPSGSAPPPRPPRRGTSRRTSMSPVAVGEFAEPGGEERGLVVGADLAGELQRLLVGGRACSGRPRIIAASAAAPATWARIQRSPTRRPSSRSSARSSSMPSKPPGVSMAMWVRNIRRHRRSPSRRRGGGSWRRRRRSSSRTRPGVSVRKAVNGQSSPGKRAASRPAGLEGPPELAEAVLHGRGCRAPRRGSVSESRKKRSRSRWSRGQ